MATILLIQLRMGLMAGFMGCECTLPSRVNQTLLLRAALNPISALPVFVLGISLPHVQTLGLVELHEVHMSTPPKPVKVALDGIPFLSINRAVDKFARGALNPAVHGADKDLKQHQFLRTPLVPALPLDIEPLTKTL